MPSKYFTILTNIGSSLHANAQIQQTKVPWTHMALGDGGGVDVQPDQEQTGLVREVHRLPITAVDPHPSNPNWIVVEAVVPNNVGGWTVRETAIYGGTGAAQCIAVGNYPASYKPVLAEGAVREMVMRMIVEISSTATVNLVIDPAVAIASRGWVESLTATTERRGLIELSTLEETDIGVDKQRAVTPEALRSVVPRKYFPIAAGQSIGLLECSGLYYSSGGSNGPTLPTPYYGWVRHSALSHGEFAFQEAFDAAGKYWRRSQAEGIWSEWINVINVNEVDFIKQSLINLISEKEPGIPLAKGDQYWAGDKTWKLAKDIPVRSATENDTGVAEIATQGEVDDGNDDARLVTPKKLRGTLAHAVPAGTVVMSAGSITPKGWIKCNGATLSRAAYAELFAAIGTVYGAGDGVSTFKIPDVRGIFPRFWSDGGANDAGRALGSIQAATAGTFDVYATAFGAGHGEAVVTDAISFNGGALINEEGGGGTTVVVNPGDLKPINIAFMGLIRF